MSGLDSMGDALMQNMELNAPNNNNNDQDPFAPTFSEPVSYQSDQVPHLRYIRVKDVGTRTASLEQRNQRIIALAQPLPEGNVLKARSLYWLVATEAFQPIFEDNTLFVWKESTIANGAFYINQVAMEGTYYINQVDFRRNKSGEIWFKYASGHLESVTCMPLTYTTASKRKPNKRIKLSHVSGESSEATSDNESNNNNTNQNDANSIQDLQRQSLGNLNNNTNVQHVPQPIPQHLLNQVRTPYSEPLFINILLLVPNQHTYIQRVQKVLLKLEYEKEASSKNFHLYSQKQFANRIRHILIVPYSEFSTATVQDILPTANDVIILLENTRVEQSRQIMTVKQIRNIMRIKDNDLVNTTWHFVIKAANFGALHLEYDQLDTPSQALLSIDELETLLSGVSCKQELALEDFEANFSKYLNEWSCKPPVIAETRQIIYLGFKCERESVRSWTSYAETALNAIGLTHQQVESETEPVTVNGCVLVYIRCPAYMPWYIMLHKEEIFNLLAEEGLTEIYECCISDIEESMRRPDNEEFMDELMHLKEQMISDGIAQQKSNRFKIGNSRKSLVLQAINAVATAAVSVHFVDEIKGQIDQRKADAQPDTNTSKDLVLPNIPFKEFVLEQNISQGPFATIFKARWNKRLVAVKSLSPADPELLIAATLYKLQPNPNIVSFLGVTTDPNSQQPMLVMEYMEEGTLDNFLIRYKHTLSRSAAISIALDVAKGLAHLHAHDIIHRDIKGENILLFDSKSRAKIADFGTSRVLPKRERANTVIGTPSFMAPEVLSEEPYDSKADVYSFGALVFGMQTSTKLPLGFGDEKRVEKIKSVVQDTEFQDLIIQCCKTDPDKRPTMKECIETLERMKKQPSSLTLNTSTPHTAEKTTLPTSDLSLLQRVAFSELKILRGIGEGGFAEVTLAEWCGIKVALKKQKGSIQSHEANILMQLRYKFIVTLMGITTDPVTNSTILILEYMKKGSLEDLLFKQRVKLSLVEIIQLALDIAKGLNFMHSQNPKVLHRNLKSANILMHGNCRAKIADFGTAKVLEELARTVIGSAMIAMPPEMLAEEDYDEKVDIFSFGVVLYEVLTNKRLPMLEEKLRQKRIQDNISNSDLLNIVLECCASDPTERPHAHQLVDVLRRIKSTTRTKK